MARKRVTENPLGVSSAAGAAPVRRKSTTAGRRTTHTASEVSPAVEVTEVTAVMPAEAVREVTLSVSRDDIARLAYSFWEARGYQGGCPEEDWLRAEQELSTRSAK